jgi:hypothetical protein
LNHQERIVDSHCDVDWGTIRARSPYVLDGSKSCRTEVHLSFGVLADQHGELGLHALGNRLDGRHRDTSRARFTNAERE